MPVSVDGSDNDDSEGSSSKADEASNASSTIVGVSREADIKGEEEVDVIPSSSSSDDDGDNDSDNNDSNSGSDDHEDDEEEEVDDFEDVYENCDKGSLDEEEGGHIGASRSSSFSTDSSSSASASSSSSVEASGGSFRRLKGCKSASSSCCPRRRCLLLMVIILVLLAVPLGMVYRFYLSRHPNGSGAGSKKQASTYASFPSSEPTYESFPTLAPSLFDDGTAAVSESPSPLPSTAYPHSNNPIASNAPTVAITGSPSVAPTAATTNETLPCNGLANLCSKRANEVLFATLHNGHAASDSGFAVFPNHGKSLEDAVKAGFRGINVDVGKCDNTVQLTHSYCFLGTRDPVEVFRNLDAWLDDKPREVLLMPTQIDNEAGGPVSLEEVWDTLKAAGNFVDKLYVRDTSDSSSQEEYPTLEELIDRNQRVLFFIYNGEQTCASLKSEEGASSGGFQCPDGLYDWFEGPGAGAETEYNFETLESIEDASQSCQVTRGDASQASFLGVNVFLNIPSRVASSFLNSADFLESHLEECAARNGRQGANAVLVDFWEEGDVLEVVRRYNEKL